MGQEGVCGALPQPKLNNYPKMFNDLVQRFDAGGLQQVHMQTLEKWLDRSAEMTEQIGVRRIEPHRCAEPNGVPFIKRNIFK